MSFVKVARADDVWAGEMAGFRVGGRRVLLVNACGAIRAYDDRCAHQGVPLSTGRLEGRRLVCSAHEWTYDACTGRGINPCRARLRALPVRIEGGDVLVDLDAPEDALAREAEDEASAEVAAANAELAATAGTNVTAPADAEDAATAKGNVAAAGAENATITANAHVANDLANAERTAATANAVLVAAHAEAAAAARAEVAATAKAQVAAGVAEDATVAASAKEANDAAKREDATDAPIAPGTVAAAAAVAAGRDAP